MNSYSTLVLWEEDSFYILLRVIFNFKNVQRRNKID